MYRFFPAQSEGNTIYVYDPQDTSKVLQTFTFPRQQVEPYLCLADFLKSRESGEMDYVGFLVVTCGSGIMEKSNEWKEKGDYLRSHALQSIALETAEGIRRTDSSYDARCLGNSRSGDMTMQQRFAARYQRNSCVVRLSGLPELGGSKPAVRVNESGGYRRKADRRIYDGAGSFRIGDGVCAS